MKNSLETRLGYFVILAVLTAIVIVEIVGSTDLFHRGLRIQAQFDTVQELKVGDRVKMAGVEVGRVEKIKLTDGKVLVTMKLQSDAIVKTDSRAVVKFAGLMGQNFVAINFGSPEAPRVVDGAVLESLEQPDLSAVMARLDKAAAGIQRLGDSFTGDKIDNLLGPLTDFVKQNSGRLGGAISNIQNVTAQIAAGQGTVGRLIYQDELYNSTLTIVTNIRNGQGTLGRLATDPTLYNSAAASMTNLSQILLKINHGEGTVGKLVNSQEFYSNAKLSLQKLDKAADSLEDTGPLSVVGIVVGRLF